MSKETLINACNPEKSNAYSWSLFFYKIDRRSKEQPYKFHKVRFKNDAYLQTYANSLINSVHSFQINPISEVQNYDGQNTKVSCDKIAVDNPLISRQWENFVEAMSKASDEKVKGKVNGYALFGVLHSDRSQTITFIKTANPITNLVNRRSVVFTATADNELELFSDTVCRLYLNTDIFVLNSMLYTFNHNFEALFDMEKTMIKAKNDAIERMIATQALSDVDAFKTYAAQYTSTRTFITLKSERIERIRDGRKRKGVATMLKIDLDDSGSLIVDTKEKASLLIRYLCFKIFKDSETEDVLEASTITKLSI